MRALSDEGEEGTAVAGTTLTGVALVDAGDGAGFHWMVFNIGDSRVYSWDGRTLEQLSVDHSAVQELVDAGLLRAEDAERHPDRNVITRAIGADEVVDPDVWFIPATGRQVFLICSDGLSKEVDDEQLADILAGDTGHAAGLAGELVDAALEHGGRDNVTVIVVESVLGLRRRRRGHARPPRRAVARGGGHDAAHRGRHAARRGRRAWRPTGLIPPHGWLAAVRGGVVLLAPSTAASELVALWPHLGDDDPMPQVLDRLDAPRPRRDAAVRARRARRRRGIGARRRPRRRHGARRRDGDLGRGRLDLGRARRRCGGLRRSPSSWTRPPRTPTNCR